MYKRQEIRYCDYVAKVDEQTTIVHLEIKSQNCEPLPITETGYKSHFIAKCLIEEFGGPIAVSYTHLDVYKRQLPYCPYALIKSG